MHQLTGAELIVNILEAHQVRIVSGIPGASNLPLYDVLAQTPSIRHVLARHEQGAGFIAQGMARVTGRPAVCLTTSGPGATNLMTAIADAKLDSVPLVAITGQVPRTMIGTDAFQEVDTYGMSIPITKHNFLVRSAQELAEVLPEAFHIASSGRKGPVLVDIPKDLLTETVTLADFHSLGPKPSQSVAEPESVLVAEAAELINQAERPILYVGGGVTQAEAAFAVLQLAEKASIPVTMTLMALGTLPAGHPLSLGMLGMHGSREANLLLDECDLLIAAGVRFDDRATGKLSEFCPQAKVIHIDIDAGELNKLKQAQVPIRGDVRTVLERVNELVEPKKREEWLQRVEELRERFSSPVRDSNNPRSPQTLIRMVAQAAGSNTIVTTDVGQHQMWVAQTYPFTRPRQLLTSGGLGTMGFGLPAAIGAALAAPERTVVCFSGDGSLLMNLQEMATAVDEQVNVKIVLLNNQSLGMVRQHQVMFYDGRVFATEFPRAVDFCGIARSFGLNVFDLADSTAPWKTLQQAFREEGPCLIHAPIEATEHVYPIVPPGNANRSMIGDENYEPAYA